jgi:hypothetical protein
MKYGSVRQVSVWLDDVSSEAAVTPAMDWACRLALPMRVVVSSRRFANPGVGRNNLAIDSAPPDREPAPIIEKIKSWGLACVERGIIMETSFWVGEPEVGIGQFFRPGGLCVLEDNRSDPVRAKLLARSTRLPEVLLLLTPATYQPMTRVLILHDNNDPSGCFLETIGRLCQALDVQPLILTLASSERNAMLKQRFAEGVCSTLRLKADFDAVISFNLYSAVDRVATWRNCSHVFFRRPKPAMTVPLWQRARGDSLSELRRVRESLTLLALPEGLALDFPNKSCARQNSGHPQNYAGSLDSRPDSTNNEMYAR